jgi:hypothetical protein
MDIARFVVRHPRLYHATFEENAPSILKHGLLTSADIFRGGGWSQEQADKELSRPRSEAMEVEWPSGDRFILRDQKPLRVSHLKKAFSPYLPG